MRQCGAMLVAAFLALVSTAAPPRRFVLEVQGVPIAELRVTLAGERYTYESTHFLEEGPRETAHHWVMKELPAPPEVWTLDHQPAPGCRQVFEERTSKLESLCVAGPARGQTRTGTIDGQPFVARYDAQRRLLELTVGAARWVSTAAPTHPPLESPFSRGLAVEPGALQLRPAVLGAKWLALPPTGVGTSDDVGRVRCLVLARRSVSERRHARLVVGLVIEDGRAFPHAWFAEGDAHFDPSVLPDDPALTERRYLEIPKEKSGAFFLQLFDGTVQLVPRTTADRSGSH